MNNNEYNPFLVRMAKPAKCDRGIRRDMRIKSAHGMNLVKGRYNVMPELKLS